MRKLMWIRKDKSIPIGHITNAHLLNIIGLINRAKDRQVKKLFPKYKVLINEARKRGLLEVI